MNKRFEDSLVIRLPECCPICELPELWEVWGVNGVPHVIAYVNRDDYEIELLPAGSPNVPRG